MAAKKKVMTGLRPYTGTISASMLKTLESCLLKYWFQYCRRENQIQDRTHLNFGTAVHSALEMLMEQVQAGSAFTEELCEKIAEAFPTIAAKEGVASLALIKEGQQMIRDRFYKHNPGYRIISTEMNLRGKVKTPKGVSLTGIIDLVLEVDSGTGIILDYKTSRRADTVEDARVDPQLSMYDYMFRKIYPQYEHVWLVLDFLRFPEPVVSERTAEERVAFEQYVEGVWDALGYMTEKDVEPTLNEYCPWCGFKHLCHEYKNCLEGESEIKPIAVLADPGEFAEEWSKAKAIEKIAKGRLDELRKWADSRVTAEGITQFESEKSVVTWSQGQQKFFDSRLILSNIPQEDLPKVMNVKTRGIEEYVDKERPDFRPLVERAKRTSPGAARLTLRKKK